MRVKWVSNFTKTLKGPYYTGAHTNKPLNFYINQWLNEKQYSFLISWGNNIMVVVQLSRYRITCIIQ